MTSVFYATFYGSTRQYAEALAGRLGTVARELPATLDAAGGPGTAEYAHRAIEAWCKGKC